MSETPGQVLHLVIDRGEPNEEWAKVVVVDRDRGEVVVARGPIEALEAAYE